MTREHKELSPVTVALFGGLGNQMFQYAFAKSQSETLEVPFCLDRRPLAAGARPYALDALAINGAEDMRIPPVPGVFRRRLKWPYSLSGTRYVFQRDFSAPAPMVPLPVYWWGTWQGLKYFQRVATSLHADFALRHGLSAGRAELAASISSAHAVAVHVRRGDYVTNPKAHSFHGTLELDWYKAAQRELEIRLPKAPTYFIFSDDADWARTNITCFKDAVLVPPNLDGTDAEDLHLFALCRHQIIANSSFSWWGAWLNRHPERCVIAPRAWFRDPRIDTSDLLPRDWVRV